MTTTKPNKDDIGEENKIDDETIELVTWDDVKTQHKVTRIETRAEAIALAEKLTREWLAKPDAFENLGRFRNNFARHRNYEIENYLDELGEGYYRIAELCPFNGFYWFDVN
jgi:hypothetical protein